LHTDDWEADESDLLLARLTAMAAGHPRTIAIVRLVRATYPTESDATNLLMEVVRLSEVQARLSWQFLVPTFTRLSLEPDARFDNSCTFAQAVAAGALQNAVLRSDIDALPAQVPRPSLFVLYAHATALSRTANLSDFDSIAVQCVRRMIALLASPISGFQFEEFHVHWHTLVMLLYSRRSDLTRLRLVAENSAVYRKPLEFFGQTVELDRNISTPLTPVLKVDQKISDATQVHWNLEHRVYERVRRLEYNQVVLPGETNNEGFDALVLHKTMAGEPHLVILECKCSKSDATNPPNPNIRCKANKNTLRTNSGLPNSIRIVAGPRQRPGE
jgi:hypothetical protein